MLDPGTATATLTLFWGPTDAGMTASAWPSKADLGAAKPGAAAHALTRLASGQAFAYRLLAVDSQGEVWSAQAATGQMP